MKKINVFISTMFGFAGVCALVGAFCFGEYRGITWAEKQIKRTIEQNKTVNEVKEES